MAANETESGRMKWERADWWEGGFPQVL